MNAPLSVDIFAALPRPELLERYRNGSSRIERRLLDLDDDQLDTFFRPEAEVGRWSCRVLIGHLADAELVIASRFRRTVGEEGPVLPNWDEDAFVDAGLYQAPGVTPAGSVAVIHTVRLWAAEWLASLPEDAWSRRALHPERGETTLESQLAHATWHLEHHVAFLALKLEKLLGPTNP
jgi:hypothetical protein